MAKYLLLIFVIMSSLLQAQRQYAIIPFEDYTNCTTGFRNERGDTIWPAQFDRVLKPMNRQHIYAQGWIVVYQGSYGLFSSEGEIVLPFEYDYIDISYEADIYQVHKEKKIGFYDKDGKELYPMVIDGIESENEHWLIFKQDGKYGVLTSGKTVALPPIYDNIEETYFYRYDPFYEQYGNLHFLLEKEKKYGLADAYGKLILDGICCPFEYAYFPKDTVAQLIMIHSERGVGLINFKNETLLPPINREIYLFTLGDPKDTLVKLIYVEVDELNKKIIGIDPGIETMGYDHLYFGKHALIFSKKNKKGILNANLEEQFIKTPYELRFGAYSPYYGEEANHSPDLPFIPGSKEQCVLVLADTESSGKSGYKRDKSYGLINVNTGEKVKPQFQTILSKFSGDEVYYFAFNNFYEDGPSSFSVYNSQLELIDTFGLNQQYRMNFNDFFRQDNGQPAFVFKNAAGKMGAIGANGKVVIPFIYDELYAQAIDVEEEKLIGRLAAKIGKKHGVIDWLGKELIPIEYESIQPFPDHYQLAAKLNAYVLYDKHYNKVIDGCQYITKGTVSALKYYNRSNEYYFKDQTFFAVKNDTAYAFFQEGFKALNEKNLNVNRHWNGLTLVGGRLLVEQSGKCILYKDYIQSASPTVYYFQQRDSICFFHIRNGVTVCLNRCTVNHSIDSYIHVNQYPNKEGLISKETGEWVLEPNNYFKILTDGKKGYHSKSDHFWYVMRGDEGLSHSMWIYDRQEKGQLERKFDVPLMNICGAYSIARSKGKFGLLDSNYSEALPFEFKNIIYSYKQFFVKGFDNRWSAWTSEKGLIPLNCSEVSLSKFTNGRLIFDGDRVAVLSDSFELLFPFTSMDDLPENTSLYTLLGPAIRSNEIPHWNKGFADENSPIGRLYNNKFICELSLVFSTRHQLTEVPFLRDKTNSLQPVLVDEVAQHIYEDRSLVYMGKRVCTYYETVVRRTRAEYLLYNNFKPFTSDDYRRTYRTMVLDDKHFRPATLKDLFLPDFGYDAWLDNYLTEVINRKQLFGLQCMNLPAILDEYKQNFFVEKSGISFSLNNENKPIVIPWSDLKDKIKTM